MSYRISDVAERTGFSASAIRFYEAEGVVPEPARTSNGYRVYDHRAVDRLVLVSRAKELGCTLDEIRDLVDAWDADDCAPVKHHLRGFVEAKIADVQRHIAEQVSLAAQLQRAAAVLASAPLDGPCDETCGCLTPAAADDDGCAPGCCAPGTDVAPVTLAAGEGAVPITCSLGASAVSDRVDEWHAALVGVVGRQPLPDGIRLTFDRADRLDEVARLTAAEHDCCRFFSFAITVDSRGVALEVRAPADAHDVVTAMFGTAS